VGTPIGAIIAELTAIRAAPGKEEIDSFVPPEIKQVISRRRQPIEIDNPFPPAGALSPGWRAVAEARQVSKVPRSAIPAAMERLDEPRQDALSLTHDDCIDEWECGHNFARSKIGPESPEGDPLQGLFLLETLEGQKHVREGEDIAVHIDDVTASLHEVKKMLDSAQGILIRMAAEIAKIHEAALFFERRGLLKRLRINVVGECPSACRIGNDSHVNKGEIYHLSPTLSFFTIAGIRLSIGESVPT
jgi:hypothetical protein